MRTLKYLSLEALVELARARFESGEDQRETGKVTYPLVDALMSGLAMMFYQFGSLLALEPVRKRPRGQKNLGRLFKVKAIPSDTQQRTILDQVDPEVVRQIFKEMFERLRRGKQLERLKCLGGKYLVVLDGSQYYSSKKIHCPGCLHKTSQRGVTSYSHQVVAATLVCPGDAVVIPMDAEDVRNQPGAQTQDCESEAAKRLIKRLTKEHPRLPMILSGDSLYAHESIIGMIEEVKKDYILVAKPGDHPELFSWVDGLTRGGGVDTGSWKDGEYNYHYRMARQVPLTAERQRWVNFFEVWVMNQDGQQVYHNSWVTNLMVSRFMVQRYVRAARARWKIENEQFNVQKNHGYEMEHNFGHGQQHLATNFFLLNVLAFLWHQILELTDRLYQASRRLWGSKKRLWERLRTLLDLWVVHSWWHLLEVNLAEEPDLPGP